MPHVFLPDQVHIGVSGSDAGDFLQGLITTDVTGLKLGEAAPGALLTPQGKILFHFLISKSEDGFQLETDRLQADALVKRLTFYRLRAKVEFLVLEATGTTVVWGEVTTKHGNVDSRFLRAGVSLVRISGGLPADDVVSYTDLRIALGIAEAGKDFALNDVFPHDVLMDLNGGVAFQKGCYIGQEVVSRMHHRHAARRRIIIVHAGFSLPFGGTDIVVDGKTVGTLGTVSGTHALAIARIDKIAEALDQGKSLVVDGHEVTVTLPAWSGLAFALAPEGSAS
ncbi:MAG: hypothetical protein RIR97_2171 [Pseudomonadota bacterium]